HPCSLSLLDALPISFGDHLGEEAVAGAARFVERLIAAIGTIEPDCRGRHENTHPGIRCQPREHPGRLDPAVADGALMRRGERAGDRKSTRLNSSHVK